MKRNITFLAYVLTLTFLFQQSNAQSPGDYRSNLTSGNQWTNVANWQVYEGAPTNNWVAALHAPTSADGVITIRTGDSVALSGASAISIDQVVVSTGSILAIFSGTFTLNNGTGDDISVDGRLRLGTTTGILNGAGSILVNSAGQFFLRTSGRLQIASTVNNGYVESDQNAFIENGSFTNNGTFNFTGTTNSSLAINTNAVFNNNGTFQIAGTGTRTITSGATNNGTFNNNATTGIINNSGGNTFTITANVIFNHLGDLRGTGNNDLGTPATNTGTVSPGGSTAGLLIVNDEFISGKGAKINIQLFAAPGSGNDQLEVSGALNVDLSQTILNIIDNASAPATGPYILMTITTGNASNFVGPFSPSTVIPSNFSGLTINAKSVTINKDAVLPLTWGSFTARENDGKVALNWTTLQESNVSHFVIEHSIDGIKFNSIGTLQATGNSNHTVAYSFGHNSPKQNARNYYRISEVDLDGKSAYSLIRLVKIGATDQAAIRVRSNPVRNGVLELESVIDDGRVVINNMNGAVVKDVLLRNGINKFDVSNLPAGVYSVIVYEGKARIFTTRIIKM